MASRGKVWCPGSGHPPWGDATRGGTARGYCARCGWDYKVRADGNIPRHNAPLRNVSR